MRCPECGADDCAATFDRLLALEFQRVEPFGRLHGITVAAYGVQHPSRFDPQVREGQWSLLRSYVVGDLAAAEEVQAARRRANSHRRGGLRDAGHGLEQRATLPAELPAGSRNIDHLVSDDGAFSPTTHAQRVREWVTSLVGR